MNSLFTFHRYFGYVFSMRTLIIIPVLLFSLLLGVPSYSADFNKGLTAAQSGDWATALKEWKPLAEEGNAAAQNNLGLMYHNGWGVPQDDKEAVFWYRLAVEQGYAIAHYNLGLMYEKGKGVPQDDKEAAQLYRLAAEQGDVDAQYNLGLMYEKGKGVPQDDKEAVRLYRLAAEQGYADAQGNLGVMYVFGKGVTKDFVYAHMWGNIASMNGNDLGALLRDDFAEKMTSSQIEEAQRLARECVKKNYKGC